MDFNEKLKKAMQQLGISQKQLVGMTGRSKASISMYVNGHTVPSEDVQSDIAVSLGLAADYFSEREKISIRSKITADENIIPRLEVEDAAKLMRMNHNTVRKGLQQGIFPWGYGIHTSENRWVYFINAARFAEIEGIEVAPELVI